MADAPEDKGFKVVDRRISAEEPEAPKTAPAQDSTAEGPVQGPGWEMRKEKAAAPLPPMDFTTFCLSLASSAMIHLGLSPSPETGKAEKALPLAKQTIDILVLLEEKTKGNLTSEEAKLLSTLLYDLRMRYVQESKQ